MAKRRRALGLPSENHSAAYNEALQTVSSAALQVSEKSGQRRCQDALAVLNRGNRTVGRAQAHGVSMPTPRDVLQSEAYKELMAASRKFTRTCVVGGPAMKHVSLGRARRAPKRRGLSYQVLCNGMSPSGPAATWVIAKNMGKPRSTVKRALEDLQRKGLVVKYVADRSGGSGPNYGPDRMDRIEGSKKQVFLWDVVRTGKPWQKIIARCELYPAFLRRHGFAGARRRK